MAMPTTVQNFPYGQLAERVRSDESIVGIHFEVTIRDRYAKQAGHNRNGVILHEDALTQARSFKLDLDSQQVAALLDTLESMKTG
jgi:hypothetical protein